MGPVEYLFLTIGVIIVIVGIARKYNNELGNSIIFMFTIATLGVIETSFADQFEQILDILTSALNVQSASLQSLFYLGTFIAVVIASYTGVTFAYSTIPRKDFVGGMFTLFVALLNGWLVAGTLWYYSNKFGYPYVGISGGLTESATHIVNNLLPQTIFNGGRAGSALTSPTNTVWWLIPPTVLMILKVRG